MKKGIKIGLLSIAMMFVGGIVTCAYSSASKQEVVAVRAEKIPAEITEETYVYEEDGNKATLVLRSDYSFTLTIEEVGKEPISCDGSYSKEDNVVTLVVNGEVVSISLNELEHTFGEYVEPVIDAGEEFKKWAQEKWETFVAPLVGGISITAILSFASTLFFNWLRNKKIDGKLVEVRNNLTECQAILKTLTNIYTEVSESKSLNEETKQILKETCKTLIEKVDVNTEQMEQIKKMEPILKLLVQLEVKIAETADGAIKAGIIEDIKEIERLVKNF